MESLKELYRIGPGPSSTHTLGVMRASKYYLEHYPDKKHYEVQLYGSLALTGKGHGTDKIIFSVFGEDNVDVVFINKDYGAQPNTMVFSHDEHQDEVVVYSTGGGAIMVEPFGAVVDTTVYPEKSLAEIQDFCRRMEMSISDYVFMREPDLQDYLSEVRDKMIAVVESGLQKDGILPGVLKLRRVAKEMYQQAENCEDPTVKERLLLSSYAYGAMEENNSNGIVVTAPTLGSCGIVASMVYYYYRRGCSPEKLVEGLAVGGIIGNIVKSNATIAGAVGGCQAEIGTACAMAAALASHIEGLGNYQIEYAAEVAMEHNLGLTCDPVGGYVQIPCIERNGVSVLRALDSMMYAKYIGGIKLNKVSFDMVVRTMKYTGNKLAKELRETSLGGLAVELPFKAK